MASLSLPFPLHHRHQHHLKQASFHLPRSAEVCLGAAPSRLRIQAAALTFATLDLHHVIGAHRSLAITADYRAARRATREGEGGETEAGEEENAMGGCRGTPHPSFQIVLAGQLSSDTNRKAKGAPHGRKSGLSMLRGTVSHGITE